MDLEETPEPASKREKTRESDLAMRLWMGAQIGGMVSSRVSVSRMLYVDGEIAKDF